MPQHKQPTSLYALCINEAQVLIETSSQNIAGRFGDYGKPRTTRAIREVQQFLLSVIGGFYLDKIFNFYRETFFKSLKHAPIYFSICLHVNMQQMTMWAWTVGWKKDESEAFWKEHLPRLTQLKQLNLSCDMSVLQAAGQHCRKLEILEIVGSDIPNEAYECLVNCKDLREINTPDDDSACSMSPEVLGFLLRSLPKLESVFGSTLSDALDSMNDLTSLQLTSVTLEPAKPQHIRAIARLCSNIKALKLENDYYEEVDTDMAPTLTALAESNINASILEIDDFNNFGPEMKGLLTQKGIFITKLCLGMSSGMKSAVSFSDIKFIGYTCPNLVSLNLIMHKILSDCSEIPTNRVFPLLESLEIWGQDWDYTLLQIILAYALKIRTLTLRLYKSAVDYNFDDEDKYFLDIPLTKLLLINPLAELQSLRLLGVTQITMDTLDKLLDSCPQLCSFATEEDEITDDYRFELLRVRIKEQNLDFHFPPAYDTQPWVFTKWFPTFFW